MNLSQSYRHLPFYTATMLVALLSFSTAADAASGNKLCREKLSSYLPSDELVTTTYYERNKQKADTDFFTPQKYLAEKSRKDILGVVETQYSEKYDTRFYFTGNSEKKNNDLPFEIDPKSRAVYIFFHGSGTAQSSGKNFYGIMNNLAKLGFSALSFDYPFHGDGPLSPKFNDVEFFMKWVDSIVQEAKKSGKPVYLVGHSYGPDVIAEYITRYPMAVNGALLMSPAGFNPVLADWYQNYTSKMKFGGEVPQNEAGGLWAGHMSSQYVWNKFKMPDPTVINPNLRVHLLSGDHEEYVPAPVGGSKKTPIGPNTYDIAAAIKVHFKNAQAVVEKGVGHYIFTHADEKGHNVVMREILKISGNDIANQKKLLDEASTIGAQMSYADRLRIRYSYDGNFKTFVDQYIGSVPFLNKMKNANESFAKNISDQYDAYSRAYELKIAEYATSGAPAVELFQKQNLALVDAARKNMKERFSQVLVALSAYLENQTPEEAQKTMNEFKFTQPAQLVNFVK